ncbi:speckle targeted PIP5K1A-regulated poly(A) polymerase-like [Liolophura sinensis]|uniref:speckle targeted PIP5K1A-regulated poly(A) polymerase-like n=1 Tax=Liolophura sinensis TaxID=3198878 RepID=UPI0031594DF6
MEKHHVISGHKIVIKPREFKPPVAKPSDPGARVPQKRQGVFQPVACKMRESHALLTDFDFRVDCLPEPESLRRVLQSCHTVEGQMKVLCEELELERDDLKARSKIVSTLNELFEQFFAACRLDIFGSSDNGFGTKGCDMDLFLDLRTAERLEKEKSGKVQYPVHVINLTSCNCPKCKEDVEPKYSQLHLRGIKSLEGKEFPVSAKSLSEVTLFDKVKLVGRILTQFHPGCSDAHVIPSIRCPVVRFSHAPTGIKCDLSVNNRLGLQNTKLLKFFCNVDPRVRPLVFALRYWGKLKEVSTNPVSGPRLTNYALSLLVVFFLQNTQPPVLPTMAELEVLPENTSRTMIDGWDCSFQGQKPEGREENKSSAEDLLVQFFQFYCSIDFSNVVLSTRTGRIIPVSEFYESLSKNDRAKYFKTGPISVQDPFVLDHNITLNVNDKVRLKLVDELNNARQICQESFSPPADKQELWGLLLLFDSSPEGATGELNTSGSKSEGKSIQNAFCVVLKMSQMSESMVKYLNSCPDYRVEWVLAVCRFLQIMLTDILLFDCTVEWDGQAVLPETVCSQAMNSVKLQADSGGIPTSQSDKGRSPKASSTSVVAADRVERPSSETPMAVTDSGNESPENPSAQVSQRLPGDSAAQRADTNKRCRKEDEISSDSVKRCKNETSVSTGEVSDMQKVEAGCSKTDRREQHDLALTRSSGRLPCLRLQCSSVYRTWNGRKPVRRHLVSNGACDSLELERKVTEGLLKADIPAKKPVLQFTCEIEAVIEPGKTAALIAFKPGKVGAKEFTCFYPFAKTYLTKAVDKYLAETIPQLSA